MTKKALYAAEAERLYVVDHCGVAEIASRLRLGEKTVRIWKDEGDWEKKRAGLIEQKQSFHQELFAFTRALLRSVKEDLDKNIKIDPGRMYALTQLIGKLDKVRDYEKEQKDAGAAKDMSAEDIVKLVQKAVGLTADEKE